MAMVTKSTTIGEVLARDINTAQFFINIGMHCLGCPHSQGESIEEACMVHGTDADELADADTPQALAQIQNRHAAGGNTGELS